MAKLTPHQKKTLRQLQHDACLARDGNKCLRCPSKKRLAASHIYPKGMYRRLEYDPDNVKTLCYPCHIHFWHKNPIDAQIWLLTAVSAKRLERLRFMAHEDRSMWSMDYELTKLVLEQELKKYTEKT